MSIVQKDAGPWYREPWPWIIMAGPVAVVIAGVVTAVIAFSGADGLVADDYYKRGLGINKELKRSAQAASLGLTAEIAWQSAGSRMRVAVHGAGPLRDDEIVLRLVHPTRAAEDRRLVLTRGIDGAYYAATAMPAQTRWKVVLETTEWRLEGEWRDPALPIALQPAG